MYSSELITRALLSGEAQYKTASLGFNGLMTLSLSRERFYVINKITIEPFLNNLSANLSLESLDYWKGPSLVNLVTALSRSWFQLVAYNKDYNLRWTFKSNVGIDTQVIGVPAATENWSCPKIEQVHRSIDCFLTTSESMYFFLVFPNLLDPGALQLSVDVLNTFFDPSTPIPTPYGGPNRTLENLLQLQTNLAGGYIYVPVGVGNLIPTFQNAEQTSLINLPIDNFNASGAITEMQLPTGAGLSDLLSFYLPSLPVLQVDYIEFNQAPTSLGLFDKPNAMGER